MVLAIWYPGSARLIFDYLMAALRRNLFTNFVDKNGGSSHGPIRLVRSSVGVCSSVAWGHPSHALGSAANSSRLCWSGGLFHSVTGSCVARRCRRLDSQWSRRAMDAGVETLADA